MALRICLVVLTAISFVLTVWRWSASRRFPLHKRMAQTGTLPGVTFLKALKGCDPETKLCLRSWFSQTYPGPVQILFGVASPDDPVCAVVRELLAEFPRIDAQLIICGESLGVNAKVSSLRQLEPHIRQPLIIMSDADVRVPADFAANITPLFRDPETGLVNCFYCLANPVNVAMEWEAMAINADFWTNVLQSRSLKPVDFALGAAIALPAAQLKAIGGFAVLSDYLADDYQLGRHVFMQNKKIALATLVAECWDAPMTARQVWAHQSRWARTIRVCQPLPYFMSILNNSTIWPVLLMLFVRQPAAWIAGGICVCVRVVTALHQQARLTQSPLRLGHFWMPPVKDLLDVLVWAAAFAGNQVTWRGQKLRILRDGKLTPA